MWVDRDVLLEISSFNDDYNVAVDANGNQLFYEWDESLDDPAYYKSSHFTGGYALFYKTYNVDTNSDEYVEISDLDELIPDSLSIFIKPKFGDGYVNIYSLYRLKSDAIFNGNIGVVSGVYYGDLATRVVAVLYSMSCRQKRLIEQYIRDVDTIGS